MNQNKNNKVFCSRNCLLGVFMILVTLNLLAVIFLGINSGWRHNQYKIYVGTNDKDTNTQLISKEETIKIVDNVCLNHLDGYTLQDSYGPWKDDKKNLVSEYTLVCIFDDADKKIIHEIADELTKKLNQSCVLIESSSVKTEYYPVN